MLPAAEAERITGYHVGGISAFGQRKRVKIFIDAAAIAHPTIIVNGGRRGLQIEIAPADLMRVLDAAAANRCADQAAGRADRDPATPPPAPLPTGCRATR